MNVKIRKLLTFVDETLIEGGREVNPPVRRAAALAVIENPFAGRYEDDLSLLIEACQHDDRDPVRGVGRARVRQRSHA